MSLQGGQLVYLVTKRVWCYRVKWAAPGRHLKDQHFCVTSEPPWCFQASSKFWWAVPQWPMGEGSPCQMACFSARFIKAVYSFLWWSWSWLRWNLWPDNGNQMSVLNQARKRVVIKNSSLSSDPPLPNRLPHLLNLRVWTKPETLTLHDDIFV